MIDMEEFCQLENWYRTTYPDLYLEYDFLDDDGCPDGETATAKYKKLQEMIKEMRASYHKPGQSVDNFAIEVEIYEKQKEALEQGKTGIGLSRTCQSLEQAIFTMYEETER